MKKIKKSDLIQIVASRLGLNYSEAERVVNTISSIIYDTLHNGDTLNWHGFGNFSVFTTEETRCRNPRTKAIMKIPAHKRPKFLPGVQLKSCIKQ